MAFLWRSTRQADDQLRRAEGSSSPGGPSEGGHHATGALAAAHLRRGGVTEVVVLNRSRERARRLADNVPRDRHPARTAPLPDELAVADVLVTCTGALGTVVPTEAVAAAVTGRNGRPLLGLRPRAAA